MDYIAAHIQHTATKARLKAKMDREYAAAEAATHVDELDAMKFAELLSLAKALKVPGRGAARAPQLREGIRKVRSGRAAELAADRARRSAESRARRAAAIAAEAAPAAAEVHETPAGKIRVGSVILASEWGSNARTQHTVDELHTDVKRGEPGWTAWGTTRWGFDHQVVRVIQF